MEKWEKHVPMDQMTPFSSVPKIDSPDRTEALRRAAEGDEFDTQPTQEQIQDAMDKGDSEEVLAEWRGEDERSSTDTQDVSEAA